MDEGARLLFILPNVRVCAGWPNKIYMYTTFLFYLFYRPFGVAPCADILSGILELCTVVR